MTSWKLISILQAIDGESLDINRGRVSMVTCGLERNMGVALLHRTTRTGQLTEDGRGLYSRARDLLAEVPELQSMFSGNGTPLRAACASTFLPIWPEAWCVMQMLMPMAASIGIGHPPWQGRRQRGERADIRLSMTTPKRSDGEIGGRQRK